MTNGAHKRHGIRPTRLSQDVADYEHHGQSVATARELTDRVTANADADTVDTGRPDQPGNRKIKDVTPLSASLRRSRI